MMDLVNTFTAISQAQTAQAIQVRVSQKVLDSQRQQGEAVLELLEAASQAAPAADVLAVKATGLGGQLDVLA
jgi:hypothetical protein